MNPSAQKTVTYIAAAAPVLFMAVLISFVVLMGGGGSAGGVAAECDTPSTAGEPTLVQYYLRAASRYRLGGDGYAFLAAINKIETGFGTNLAVSSAGAIGWMQFEPTTFRQYAVSVTDPHAPADPDDPQDAIYTAANYLHASGAPGDWQQAIYAYNHSSAYVTSVMSVAQRYLGPDGLANLRADIAQYWGTRQQPDAPTPAPSSDAQGQEVSLSLSGCANSTLVDDVTPVNGSEGVLMPNGLARPGSQAPANVQAMVAAGDRISSEYYSFGGGYCVAAMNQTTPDPQACPGDQENGGPGYDCASSTSYVLWGGGYSAMLDDEVMYSGALESVGVPGVDPQGWVTWYASAGHAFIEVDGLVLDTVPGITMIAPPGAPSTGPRWHTSAEVHWELTVDTSVGAFSVRHPANL